MQRTGRGEGVRNLFPNLQAQDAARHGKRFLTPWTSHFQTPFWPKPPGREAADMAASDSFSDLMAGLRAGDEAAAREIFDRFVRKLVKLAGAQFDAVLRRKVDPEDVVQSAYKSFFLRYGAGK